MGIALALTATTVVINPTNTEAKSKKVTYVSTKQAGKKIAALQKMLFSTLIYAPLFTLSYGSKV